MSVIVILLDNYKEKKTENHKKLKISIKLSNNYSRTNSKKC